jgi:hypothetical protein
MLALKYLYLMEMGGSQFNKAALGDVGLILGAGVIFTVLWWLEGRDGSL